MGSNAVGVRLHNVLAFLLLLGVGQAVVAHHFFDAVDDALRLLYGLLKTVAMRLDDCVNFDVVQRLLDFLIDVEGDDGGVGSSQQHDCDQELPQTLDPHETI